MKTHINLPFQFEITTASIFIPLALAWLGFLPQAQATDLDSVVAGNNTADGVNVLINRTTGLDNSGFGFEALKADTSGSYNTATGIRALTSNVSGLNNTADGAFALAHNNAGGNTATGFQALYSNFTGARNNAFGYQALFHHATGNYNNAFGSFALGDNTGGTENNAFGDDALSQNTGSDNTAIGDLAGSQITTGSGNVCIGAAVFGDASESNTTHIRNIGSTPIVGGATVVVAGTGGNGDQRLGYASSSRRYKEEIKPMDKASETLFALKPVTFRAKGNMDPAHVKHYGLIAEDVAAVDADLVVYNPEGKPETVRFESINAMLLNEFLKEHRKVEEQQATIAKLKDDLETVVARLKEQDAKIQKVSDKLEPVDRPMQHQVAND